MALRAHLAALIALTVAGLNPRAPAPPLWLIEEGGRRRPDHEGRGKCRGNSRMRPPKRNQKRMKYGGRYYGQTLKGMRRAG